MEAVMDDSAIDDIIRRYRALAAVVPLRPIRSAADYDRTVKVLNQLLDAGASDERHPLADLVGTLGELVADYDATHYPPAEVSGARMLRFLMEQHQLKQSDLPEIGTQGVVSEILSGKRELNVRQIKALSERFGVNGSVFL